MKLTNREKTLLLVLLLVVIVFATYRYIYTPIVMANEEALENLASVQQDIDNVSNYLMDKNNVDDLLNQIKLEAMLLEVKLPPVVHQEDIILYMDQLMKTNNLNYSGMYFTTEDKPAKTGIEAMDTGVLEMLGQYEDYLSVGMPITQGQSSETSKAKDASANEDEKPYDVLAVSVTFEGSYDDLKAFLNDIYLSQNTILVTSLNVNKISGHKDRIACSADFEFPYYYDGEIIELMEWDTEYNVPGYDPFDYKMGNKETTATSRSGSSIASSVQSSTTLEPSVEAAPKEVYDFSVTAMPPGSNNLPFSIGTAYDRSISLSTFIGDDTIGLRLKEENGQYYMQYYTSFATYPSEGEYVPFEPMGDVLKVQLVSTPRIGAEDVKQGKLVIENNTSMPMAVHVYYDDAEKPRLAIVDQYGNVTVENK